MKYYLIQNMGYDGLLLDTFDTLTEAETRVKDILREQREWDEKYPNHPSDKGFIIIRGEVVIGDNVQELGI